MIKMAPNKVLIRRLGLQDEMEGVLASDHEDSEHRLLSNVGIVEAVCSELRFTRDEVLWLNHIGRGHREIQEATRHSCMYLAEIEAKVGDKVIYRRINNVNEDEVLELDRLVIPHDDLIARINDDGTLYPLCGNILIEDRQEPITKVVSCGKPLYGYFDHARYNDFKEDITGRLVAINPNQAIPVADAIFSEYKLLAYIKRRHILLYFDET